MNATWRTLGTLCRSLDWSEPRLVHELQNGLPYRTVPPGHIIDWHDPNVLRSLEVKASTVTLDHVRVSGEGRVSFFGAYREVIGIEVLPPDALPAPTPPPSVSQAAPPPRKVSAAEVERCFRDIVKEHPNDPLSEPELFAEMKRRLGASPGRNRLRQLRRVIAPQWRRPRGHPHNFNSAKKSAV